MPSGQPPVHGRMQNICPPWKLPQTGSAPPSGGSGQSDASMHGLAHAPTVGGFASTAHTPSAQPLMSLMQSPHGGMPAPPPHAQKKPPRQFMPSGHAAPPEHEKKQPFCMSAVSGSQTSVPPMSPGSGQSQTSLHPSSAHAPAVGAAGLSETHAPPLHTPPPPLTQSS